MWQNILLEEKKEKCTKKANDKNEDADSLIQLVIFNVAPKFKILIRVVSEKSLKEKRKFTHRHIHRQTLLGKRQKTIYHLHTLYAWGIKILCLILKI